MKKNEKRKLFIGIDLGGKKKKTTGICILDYNPPTASSHFSLRSKWAPKKGKNLIFFEDYCQKCQDVVGGQILKVIKPYLKDTKVIAIDAPLTKGRGKGDMRLYEKFLSTKIFRQEKIAPIPPALMSSWCSFAREIKRKLEKKGFVLDLNLIEVFPTLVKKISQENLFLKFFPKGFKKFPCKTENQKSALICAILAFLHFNFKTRYLGYKDGFLFLPEMSFWKKEWRQKFYQAWMERSRLKYKYLITNIFDKK
ncbi:hypothetical protein KJA15_03670 [Patescibacteria group bacterium]|nr:hypothetical protein [Patescibacteria group bacterium]